MTCYCLLSVVDPCFSVVVCDLYRAVDKSRARIGVKCCLLFFFQILLLEVQTRKQVQCDMVSNVEYWCLNGSILMLERQGFILYRRIFNTVLKLRKRAGSKDSDKNQSNFQLLCLFCTTERF